jgi:hypothetical protein
MAMVRVEHETLFAQLDIGKCLPGEHFVELHPLDYWGLDRAGRVEMLRVLQTLAASASHEPLSQADATHFLVFLSPGRSRPTVG